MVKAVSIIAKPYEVLFNFLADGFNSIAKFTGISVTAPTSSFSSGLKELSDSLSAAGVQSAEWAGETFGRMKEPIAAMEALRTAITESATATDDAAAAAEGMSAALDDVAESAGGGAGGKSGAAPEIVKLTPALESASSAMDGFESAGRSAFTQLVTGAKGLNRTLSDLLAKFAEVLANSAFDSIIGAISGSGKKGGGNGDLLSSVVSAVAGSFAGSFDGGGNIPRGQFGIAGERGMELVQGPAHITSRADTARMMGGGGGGVVVNVDARGAQQGVAQQITQGISRAIPEITAAVRSGINGRQSRGYSV